MKITKKPHFVPKKYLREWCNKQGKIWTMMDDKIFVADLDRVANQRYFYRFNPNFTKQEADLARALFSKYQNYEIYSYWVDIYEQCANAVKNNLNEISIEYVEKQLEEEINCKLEDIFYPILNLIKNGNVDFYSTNLDEKNEDVINNTIDFLYGLMEINLRTKNMKNRIIMSINKDNINKDINIENLWMLTRHQFAILLGELLYKNQFQLYILEDKTSGLITGDQPVFNSNPKFENDNPTNLEYYCPISPTKAILLTKEKNIETTLSINKRDFYNKLVRDESESQIYSNSKQTLEYVLKL